MVYHPPVWFMGKRVVAGSGLADLNKKDEHGEAPLHLACKRGHTDAVRSLLHPKHIDVNSANDVGRTPLHLACENGHLPCVKLLVRMRGINVNQTDAQGKTPLHVTYSRPGGTANEIAMTLISVGADPRIYDDCDHKSPLDLARELHGNSAAEFLAFLAGNLRAWDITPITCPDDMFAPPR